MSYVCTAKRKLDVTIQEDSRICIIILHLLYQSAHLPESSSSSVSQSPQKMCSVLIFQPHGEGLDWSPPASPTSGKHLNGRPAAARLSFSSLYYYFKFQVMLRKCSISNKHLLTKYNLWGSKKREQDTSIRLRKGNTEPGLILRGTYYSRAFYIVTDNMTIEDC